MTRPYLPNLLFSLACALFVSMSHAAIAPGELVAPKFEIVNGNLKFTIQPSVLGRNYQLQVSDTMAGGTWTDIGVVRSGDGSNLVISTPHESGVQRRFYRVALVEATPTPDSFALITAGSFLMGNALSASGDGSSDELPQHSVMVSAFYMAQNLVTKAEWDSVRTWGSTHDYTDLAVGAGKATNHPVQTITWYDMVKWCNARSEKDGLQPCYTLSGAVYRKTNSDAVICNWSANGYRLPTEAEWEKAARGGLSGKRFPWGDTITHSQANYYSDRGLSYDVSSTRGYYPTYAVNGTPFTSPVRSFSSNGYGLYDMAGNVWEWCWDWYSESYYATSPATDSRGASSGSIRVLRGGDWYRHANDCRVASRSYGGSPTSGYDGFGFRIARSSVP